MFGYGEVSRAVPMDEEAPCQLTSLVGLGLEVDGCPTPGEDNG